MDSNVLVVKCRKWNIIGIIYSVHYVSRISELAISYFLFIVSTNVIVTKHHVVFNDLRLLLFIIIIILKWQMPNTLQFYVFLSPNGNKKIVFGLNLMTNWCEILIIVKTQRRIIKYNIILAKWKYKTSRK